MENLVAVPIERKIRELAEVKDIRTLAGEGSLTIYVDLKDEIGNVNATWQRLRDKMGDVKVELPDGVVGPFVNSDFGDVAIATIAITGEGFSAARLKDVAEDFRKKLYQLSGISKVELLGVQDERVWLELDTRKLAAVGVQVNTLIKDLQGQNVVLPSGNINANGTRLLLETSGDFPSVRAIETMLTRVGTTDSLVRLADLVTVRRDYVSPKVKPIYFNGRPAVVLSVVMQPDQDVTQLGRKLRAASREYEERLPIGYAIDFATYQADQVSASVNSASVERGADLHRRRRAGDTFSRIASRDRRGDDRSVRRHVCADRHAGARHRARAGIDRRDHHRARLAGRQRRGDRRGYRQPDRSRRAAPGSRFGLGRAVCTSAPDLIGHHDRRVPAAVAAVGIVRRICVLAGCRGGFDSRRFMDHGALHSARADRLADRPTRRVPR